MTGKPELAYDVYHNMDVSSESLMLLDFVANECYKVMPYFSLVCRHRSATESVTRKTHEKICVHCKVTVLPQKQRLLHLTMLF